MDPNDCGYTFQNTTSEERSNDCGYTFQEREVPEEELIAPSNTPVLDFEVIDLQMLTDALKECAVCKNSVVFE